MVEVTDTRKDKKRRRKKDGEGSSSGSVVAPAELDTSAASTVLLEEDPEVPTTAFYSMDGWFLWDLRRDQMEKDIKDMINGVEREDEWYEEVGERWKDYKKTTRNFVWRLANEARHLHKERATLRKDLR
ncbi:hypothetical protein EAI_08292 [Harpegnathos saltator]|uniref:Uncharacterized protein n=1 Tax=Harpegnathos saltator TaxID=610380 RepID=E2C6Y5_HARSA|nr:hypothetical protein EAI_08292 [Harpegnathos saltator]